MANKKTTPKLEWRLPELMGRRRISTATELKRRLDKLDVNITSSQLARIINSEPLRISAELLWGLTLVLECTIDDLLYNPDLPKSIYDKKISSNNPSLKTAEAYKERKRELPDENPENILGPKLSSYPKSAT